MAGTSAAMLKREGPPGPFWGGSTNHSGVRPNSLGAHSYMCHTVNHPDHIGHPSHRTYSQWPPSFCEAPTCGSSWRIDLKLNGYLSRALVTEHAPNHGQNKEPGVAHCSQLVSGCAPPAPPPPHGPNRGTSHPRSLVCTPRHLGLDNALAPCGAGGLASSLAVHGSGKHTSVCTSPWLGGNGHSHTTIPTTRPSAIHGQP